MFKFIYKIIPALISWGVFILVVLYIPYPESLTQANLTQLIPFFASLYLSLSLTFNVFLKNIPVSSSVSLGLIFLLILKALDSLNLVTLSLIVVATGLLTSYFRKVKKRDLTKLPKIPKIRALRRD